MCWIGSYVSSCWKKVDRELKVIKSKPHWHHCKARPSKMIWVSVAGGLSHLCLCFCAGLQQLNWRLICHMQSDFREWIYCKWHEKCTFHTACPVMKYSPTDTHMFGDLQYLNFNFQLHAWMHGAAVYEKQFGDIDSDLNWDVVHNRLKYLRHTFINTHRRSSGTSF